MALNFTTDFFSQHAERWRTQLARLAGKPDISALEVGCFEGRSACWLLEHVFTHPTARLWCVDTFDFAGQGVDQTPNDIMATFTNNIAAINAWGRVDLRKGPSFNVLTLIAQQRHFLPVFDFVYIDGSHVARNVLEDTVLAWPLVKPGGIFTWDDYEWSVAPLEQHRPRVAIDAFMRIYEGQYDLLHTGWQVTVKKL